MPPQQENIEAQLATRLVDRIRQGDSDAESDLVETYRQGLMYQLRLLSQDAPLREDLFQDTFSVVLQKVRDGALFEPEKLAGFIRKTAKNIYIADYRKKNRRGHLFTRFAEEPKRNTTADPLAKLEREQEAKIVRQVIGKLSTERDRRMLFRFYVAQEDKEVICADLNIDPQIFNRLLYRARQRFKELWLAQVSQMKKLLQHGLLLLLRW